LLSRENYSPKIQSFTIIIFSQLYHNHSLLVPLSGVGTICFLLPFSFIFSELYRHHSLLLPLSWSAQYVFFFHSVLALVTPFFHYFFFIILMLSFTHSIHLLLNRPLLGCQSTFMLMVHFVMWLSTLGITCSY
jgi:hypothetical protein